MFEQLAKTFQDAGAGVFYRAAQEAAAAAQKRMAKTAADATEYVQLEVSGVVALAQSSKPEQAIEALNKAVKARQEFVARKAKELFDEVSGAGAEMARQAEAKSQDFASHASTAVDTAFANVKQGMSLAESATKSVVSKVSKASKG